MAGPAVGIAVFKVIFISVFGWKQNINKQRKHNQTCEMSFYVHTVLFATFAYCK